MPKKGIKAIKTIMEFARISLNPFPRKSAMPLREPLSLPKALDPMLDEVKTPTKRVKTTVL